MTNWKTANAILTDLYNKGVSDKNIAIQLGTTTIAVARQRSNLGLVKFKQKPHSRAPKTEVAPAEQPHCVLHYCLKDGRNHFLVTPYNRAADVARNLMVQNGTKSITMYSPTSKFVLNGVTEIKL